jgi:ABC-2 type transport system ATP-binding protein
MDAAIEVVQLGRKFRLRQSTFGRRLIEVEALGAIDFAVQKGELFGLLGPNGAGKTTTIKILTTLLLPSSGRAWVLGLDPVRDARKVRPQIGYVFGGERGLYDRLSALDNLRYFADLYRVPAAMKRRRIQELLDLVGLAGRERERVEGFSRGMRQRLHIARGLLHDPPVLFLDEPSIGLDPLGARELRQLIASLRAAGKTILLTTHYMFEADELCDRVAVINRGKIIAQGTPAELKTATADGTVIEIQAYGVNEEMLQRLRVVPGVASLSVEEGDQVQTILVQSANGSQLIQSLMPHLEHAHVGKVTAREPTLEDAYVRLVSAS